MPLLRTSQRLWRQPRGPVRVDWSNPIASGLRSCIVPGVSGWVDLVDGVLWTLGDTTFTRKVEQDQSLSVMSDSTGNFSELAYRSINGAAVNKSSLMNVGRWDLSNDHNFREPPGMRSGGADRWNRVGFYHFNGDGDWTLYDRDFASNYTVSAPGGQTNDTIKRAVASLSADLVSVAVNGRLSTATPTTVSTDLVEALSVGWNWGGCRVTVVAYWARTLSAVELVSLSLNPWQLFAPINTSRPIYYNAAQFARPIADVSNSGWRGVLV